MTSKKDLSERDIITKFIIPAIKKAGWSIEKQVREEVFFTDGRIFVKGNKTVRGERKRADIILYYKPNIPIAIIEAKDNKHSIGAGLQQALNYADILDIPVAFSSNRDGFIEHDNSGYAFSHSEYDIVLFFLYIFDPYTYSDAKIDIRKIYYHFNEHSNERKMVDAWLEAPFFF